MQTPPRRSYADARSSSSCGSMLIRPTCKSVAGTLEKRENRSVRGMWTSFSLLFADRIVCKSLGQRRSVSLNNGQTIMIESLSGDRKYTVSPCRLRRMINSFSSWPVDILYMSLTSEKGMISIDLHERPGDIGCVLTYGLCEYYQV